jgi:pSer/pThr/pTyr-binding forkhead associated (FHA) protein
MAAASSNTVSLTIVKGESPNPTATFSNAMAARMVSVGSGPAAHWKVRAQGVDAVHAELYWDGNILWLRNGGSAAGTFVAGQRADDWMQIFDGVEVQMGTARISSKVVGPDARNPAGTNPGITSKSAGYIDEEESTMVFANVGLLKAASEAVAPRSTKAPTPAPQSSPPNNQGRVGTMAPPTRTSGVGNAPISAPPMAPRPPMAPPQPEPEIQKPPSSEATVIRQSPYAAIEAAGGVLPAAGNRNPMPGGNHTMAPGGAPMGMSSSVHVSPSAVSLPVVTPGVRPVTMAGPTVSPALQPVYPMHPSTPSSAGVGSMSQSGAYEDPFGPIDAPLSSSESKKAVPPTRTLILAGVTLVIGLIAAVLPPPRRPPARPTNAMEVLTVGAPPPQTNNILQLPISEPGLVGVIVPPPVAVDPATNRPRVSPSNPNDAMKLAADALAGNRLPAALEIYERLATEHPEAPLFRQFSAVIRARLATANCPQGAPGCAPDTTNSPPPSAPPSSPSPPR